MQPPSPAETSFAPRGTAWYYATLHLPAGQRDELRALQAWWRAVRSIPASVSEPDVAMAKLGWWRAQLDAAASGRPDHPLLLALQPALRRDTELAALLAGALEQVDAGMRQNRWMDWAALRAHVAAGPGRVARAAARLSGDTEAADHAEALGIALALVGMLRDVGRDVRLGIVHPPIDLLSAHQVKAAQLLKREDSPALRALLADFAARAAAELDAAHRVEPRLHGGGRRAAAALARIARAQLAEMKAADHALLEQRIILPPLRLLWGAWRARFDA